MGMLFLNYIINVRSIMFNLSALTSNKNSCSAKYILLFSFG